MRQKLSTAVVKEPLRSIGLKATQARLRILKFFEHAKKRHMSAEEVYDELAKRGARVPLPTLYRVLTHFEQAGLLRRHHFDENRAVYELNELGHHDHMVCVKCGWVEEFCDEDIESRQNKIAQEKGFALKHHALCLFVDCKTNPCPHTMKS